MTPDTYGTETLTRASAKVATFLRPPSWQRRMALARTLAQTGGSQTLRVRVPSPSQTFILKATTQQRRCVGCVRTSGHSFGGSLKDPDLIP